MKAHKLIKLWLALRKQSEWALIIENKALLCAYDIDLPEKLRPATEADIVKGALIWYKHGGRSTKHEGFWCIVDEVENSMSRKHYAYTAHDGCCYGLDDAWVEESE